MKRVISASMVALALALAVTLAVQAEPEQRQSSSTVAAQPSEAALKRTRRTVRMLDDIYKQTVILITDKYVHTEDHFPAGSAAVALFKAITEKGWHKVRLIDVTGEPYDPNNVARDAFEKKGVEALKKGKDYYDQVVEEDGEHRLRAITAIPVVMDKCIMCHPHYEDAKDGEAIGAITYSLPID